METLETAVALDGFLASLRPDAPGILLLDYDGTLAPFRAKRIEAEPYAGVRPRLEAMSRSRSPVARPPVVISGRPAREVVRLLGMGSPPEIWGCHGWERLDPQGDLTRFEPDADASDRLERAFRVALELLADERVEHKGAAVAAHFRGLSPEDRAEAERALEGHWRPIAEAGGPVALRFFDGGLEVRAEGRHKGMAVRDILERDREGVRAVYLGDDLTDEDAFREVRARGGLAVLVRPKARASAADVWIRPPGELLAFLDRWMRHTGLDPVAAESDGGEG